MKFHSRKKAKGLSLGYILVIIVLLMALAGAAAKFFSSSSTPNTSSKQADVMAATLASQGAQLKDSLTLLALSTNSTWTDFGVTGQALSLANGATPLAGLPTDHLLPIGPVNANGSGNITWHISAPDGSGHIYAFTSPSVSSAACVSYNTLAIGRTTMADPALAASLTAAAGTPTAAGVTNYDVSSTNVAADLAGYQTGCFQSAAGSDDGAILITIR